MYRKATVCTVRQQYVPAGTENNFFGMGLSPVELECTSNLISTLQPPKISQFVLREFTPRCFANTY